MHSSLESCVESSNTENLYPFKEILGKDPFIPKTIYRKGVLCRASLLKEKERGYKKYFCKPKCSITWAESILVSTAWLYD